MRNKIGLIGLVLATAIFIYLCSIIGKKIVIALTDSTSHTVYWIDNSSPKKGDYVIFRLKLNKRYFSDFIKKHEATVTVVKRVICVPGDHLVVRKRKFFCNGKYIGTAKEYSLKGIKTKVFHYNGVVPKGDLFVIGSSINSYDSRYFGFIRKDEVQNTAVPIF